VAQQLGLILIDKAEGSTGYTTASQPGTVPYPALVDEIIGLNPDIVIAEGSRNDTDPAKTRVAAQDTLARLRNGLPRTKILVIGPIYSFATNQRTTPVNDAVKAAAASIGLTYIDTVAAGWFTGPSHSLIGSDGVHPTDEGHRYLANLIEPLVQQALQAS
jgi:lysophospholipase L1-like esterase